jgi:hypothetical protein
MPNGLFTLTQVNQAIRQGAWTGFIPPTWVEYLVVAGGGGGGYIAGGGGAGGLLTGVVTVASGVSYTVTVGSGGAGGTGGNAGASGANAVFGAISATGGGAGGSYPNSDGASGGSGGGADNPVTLGGLHGVFGQGIAGQGNAGGLSWAGSNFTGGGGGGAGTVGLNSAAANSSAAGNGGAGIASAITGTVNTYAGGGGGAADTNGTGGSGGVGGGGAGGVSRGATGGSGTINGVSGGGNTGGGGGGYGVSGTGGSGGSGVVIIRYPGTVQYFTGGTLSYANGYVVHTFNASGTFAPTTPTPYIVEDYQISRSLRFNQADNAFLNRTPASASNRRTWTWSAWVKRGLIGGVDVLLNTRGDLTDAQYFRMGFGIANPDTFFVSSFNSTTIGLETTALFRDPSAWYHVVFAFDTTQATASNRIKLYVNGVQQTAFGTANYPSQNFEAGVNAAVDTAMGRILFAGGTDFDGYMTEVNFIDGQALTPSSFGYYNFNTGVWSPTRYVGVYGTNGFYLNFSDNSNTTAATLGADYSGNGNNWTPNNFSVSAGAGNDSLVDSPTSYGTDTGVGGTVRGNYCTLNPLDKQSSITLANGNLDVTASGTWVSVRSTFGMTSGKWYWETTFNGFQIMIGIGTSAATLSNYIGADTNGWAYYFGGDKFTNSTPTAYGASYTTGDIIGIAFDADTGSLTFYKNGTSQGVAFTGLTSGPYFPALGLNNATPNINFGQRPFAYTAPSGFKALNTQNLPTPTIGATPATQAGEFFAPVTYTGNGTTQTITVGFQPDFVWIKNRGNSSDHGLFDVLRGVTRRLSSNTTAVENTISGLTAFTADGFTIGIDYNNNNLPLVSWNWKANGAGVTNTAGSITSTVSANTTSGFSVVTYTATGSVATIGHGLGVAPRMVILKGRSGTTDWFVYHASIGATKGIYLNQTSAEITSANFWNNTAPTSTVFTAGTGVGGSGVTMVAYCFAEVPGYSRFGSYTGNGSADGPFVFCGFRPRYVMIKRADATNNWILKDTTRAPYNADGNTLIADLPDSEYGPSNTLIDELSNGFKCRDTSASINFSGNTYIFMAFAEAPQKFALAR